jgi:hypothetical protein
MFLLLVGNRIKKIVLTTLMHQDVSRLQMVRNTLLLLVERLLQDMTQHRHLQMVRNTLLLLVERLLQDMTQHHQLKKHHLLVLQVNLLLLLHQLKKHHLLVLQVNLLLLRHQPLNYS